MEPTDLGGSSTRKVRFAPKAPPPPRRKKAVLPKVEEDVPNEADAQAAQDLLRRFNEHLGRRGPKVEKKSSVRVAFCHGAESSTCIKSYGKLSGIGVAPAYALNDATQTNEQITVLSPSTTSVVASSLVPVDASSSRKIKKDYKEPWDYHHSDYPITLPLRRPYSGDPEKLDEKEFGKGAELDYDEGVTNSAAELGLLDENEDEKMLFLQLPPNLPFVRRRATADGHVEREDDIVGSSVPLQVAVSSASAQGKERVGSSSGLGVSPTSKRSEMVGSFVRPKRSPLMKGCSFEELPAGYMGKMLVYKSGAIKLKLGDTLYDVSPGSDCIFAQDIVAINTADEKCCRMGEIGKRAIVTPDIDSLLADEMDLS